MIRGNVLVVRDEDFTEGNLPKARPQPSDFKISIQDVESVDVMIYVNGVGVSTVIKNRYGRVGYII